MELGTITFQVCVAPVINAMTNLSILTLPFSKYGQINTKHTVTMSQTIDATTEVRDVLKMLLLK